MIIISQDRNKILNFDNVNYIEISRAFDPSSKNEIIFNYGEDWFSLGGYQTMERAKEILEEIAYLYVINQSGSTIDSEYRKSICYEMPEK